jgi:cell wall-associated NlpC family hydrolase
MIKKLLYIFTVPILLTSCGSTKNAIHNQNRKTPTVKKETVSIADKIIWTAVSYKGTPYKYGGTTKKGMDCSGLIYTSFKTRNITLPRTSSQMYSKGHPISLNQVKRGDLLFFKTTNKKGKVNHVGLVTSIKNGDIRFIHSSSSKGVIVSSLKEAYWKKSFIKAKRVL